MPFLDHLEELRWRIFKSLGALFAATLVGFLVVHYLGVVDFLRRPIEPYVEDGKLAAFSPLTPFLFEIKLALLVGVLLAFPILGYQVWAFFAPALEPRERKIIIPSLYMGLVLFALGAALAYLIMPLALNVLLTYFQADYLVMIIGANEYLGFMIRLLLAFGLLFELPVVIMVLTAFGLVTPTFLREKRRHSLVGIAVLAAFITPADVISMLALMVPVALLYELSIFLSAAVYRRREGEENSILAPGPGDGPPEGAVEMTP